MSSTVLARTRPGPCGTLRDDRKKTDGCYSSSSHPSCQTRRDTTPNFTDRNTTSRNTPVRAKGLELVVYVAGPGEYTTQLRDKLTEEVAEFLASDSDSEELAGVLEVV
jgi:hypothetical protein